MVLIVISFLVGSISSASFVNATEGSHSPFDLIFKSIKNLEQKDNILQNQVNALQTQVDKLNSEVNSLLHPTTITVSTDKVVYDHNSIIMVSGHVDHPYPGQDVGMKVTSPSGNIVSAAQLTVDSNGDYTTKLNTASPIWTENGVYTIYVQQGDDQSRTATVHVEVIGWFIHNHNSVQTL